MQISMRGANRLHRKCYSEAILFCRREARPPTVTAIGIVSKTTEIRDI
jgi:hypothetical protein